MTLFNVSPAIEPRNTGHRVFFTAIMAVMKNVLSPISEAVIIKADVMKDDRNEVLFSSIFEG